MKEELTKLLDENTRKNLSESLKKLTGNQKPAQKIAEIVYEETK